MINMMVYCLLLHVVLKRWPTLCLYAMMLATALCSRCSSSASVFEVLSNVNTLQASNTIAMQMWSPQRYTTMHIQPQANYLRNRANDVNASRRTWHNHHT